VCPKLEIRSKVPAVNIISTENDNIIDIMTDAACILPQSGESKGRKRKDCPMFSWYSRLYHYYSATSAHPTASSTTDSSPVAVVALVLAAVASVVVV
jgi:hypothetical protein